MFKGEGYMAMLKARLAQIGGGANQGKDNPSHQPQSNTITSSTSSTTASSASLASSTGSSTQDQHPGASPTTSTSDHSTSAATAAIGGQPTAGTDSLTLTFTPTFTPVPTPFPQGEATSTADVLAGASVQSTTSVRPSTISSGIPLTQASTEPSSNGMTSGAIAAAAIVPLFVIALVVAVFFMLRRRRRQPGAAYPQMKERSTARDNANGTSEPFVSPIMTSNMNTAYYTGLDTGSEREHSGEFYAPGRSDTSSLVDPPPPYKAKTHDPSGGPIQASAIGGVPLVRLPTGMPASPPSPDSWATAPHDAAFLDTGSAFGGSSSRGTTEPSINSDLYSDGASVHSAHAARMSVAGANVISPANASQDAFNPFDDPASPVSSVDGDEQRSLQSPPSRAISPVSFRSRP